jgi:TPR repeat protein
MGGMMALNHKAAEGMIQDFMEKKDKMDQVELLKKLAKDAPLQSMTHLAMVVGRVPDSGPVNKSGRLPPSIHPELSRQLLMACVRAGERTAVLHVLRLVLRRSDSEYAKRRASQFTSTDLRIARQQLEALAEAGDADAKTLLGQLLEQERSSKRVHEPRAHQLWQEAHDIKVADMARQKVAFKDHHQLELPQMEPWNLLGCALLQQQDPDSRERAKALFKTGALQADDPISYYYLASLEDRTSGLWLQYITKAAASGVADAMYELANFYADLGESNSKAQGMLKTDGLLAKSTNWITSFKKNNGPKDIAIEWYKVAADAGSKAAMWKLAEMAEAAGDLDTAAENLEEIVEAPPDDSPDGADLVRAANKKLQSPEYHTRRGVAAAKKAAAEGKDGFQRKNPGLAGQKIL